MGVVEQRLLAPPRVEHLAQLAAVASLEAYDELQERVDALMTERSRVADALAEQGWEIPESQANFVWLPLGDDALAFAAAAPKRAAAVGLAAAGSTAFAGANVSGLRTLHVGFGTSARSRATDWEW